jgi:hypothetical protein
MAGVTTNAANLKNLRLPLSRNGRDIVDESKRAVRAKRSRMGLNWRRETLRITRALVAQRYTQFRDTGIVSRTGIRSDLSFACGGRLDA